MPESGGPTTQSGIAYQNLIAAYYVAEMLNDIDLPATRRVISVRIEARTDVDDVVVRYEDGHRRYIQVKENLETSGDTWRDIWSDFSAQFRREDFRKAPTEGDKDALCLYVDSDRNALASWGESLRRTRGADDFDTWLQALNNDQREFWQKKVSPLLISFSAEERWQFLQCVRCEVHTQITTEFDILRLLPIASNAEGRLTPFNLLSLLKERLPEDAASRLELFPGEIKQWLEESHQVRLAMPPAVAQLKESVSQCSSVLRAQRDQFGTGGTREIRHVKRPAVAEILNWLLPADLQARLWENSIEQNTPVNKDDSEKDRVPDNIAVLLDKPGRGKTVVLRDVLATLESLEVTTLAIKTDRQLGDLSSSRAIHECAGVRLPIPVEDAVRWLAKAEVTGKPVVVILDQVDALSLTMARDGFAIEAVAQLVNRLRGISGVRVLLACRTFDLHTTPALRALDVKKKFALPELTKNEVKSVLADTNIDYDHLALPTQTLLATPLHLDLFLRTLEAEDTVQVPRLSSGDRRIIRSLQDLYALLWECIVASSDAPFSVADRIAVVFPR